MRNLEMNPDYQRAVTYNRIFKLHRATGLNYARRGDEKTCARYMGTALHWVMQASKLFDKVKEQIIV